MMDLLCLCLDVKERGQSVPADETRVLMSMMMNCAVFDSAILGTQQAKLTACVLCFVQGYNIAIGIESKSNLNEFKMPTNLSVVTVGSNTSSDLELRAAGIMAGVLPRGSKIRFAALLLLIRNLYKNSKGCQHPFPFSPHVILFPFFLLLLAAL